VHDPDVQRELQIADEQLEAWTEAQLDKLWAVYADEVPWHDAAPEGTGDSEMTGTKLPEDCHLAYIVSHEAWYAHAVADRRPEISVTAAADGGGCAWEFTVEEVDLGASGPAIRVKVFEDAFAAFAQIPEFFAALAAEKTDTLDGVRSVLDRIGAADETERRSSKYGERRSSKCGEIPAKATANRIRKAITDSATPDDATAAVLRVLGAGEQ
jgi:hypothetical protein